jgi:hypothetical protein
VLDDAVAAYRESPSAAWLPCSWQHLGQELRAADARRRHGGGGGGGSGSSDREGWQVQLRAPVAELRELWRRRLEVGESPGRSRRLLGLCCAEQSFPQSMRARAWSQSRTHASRMRMRFRTHANCSA